MHLFVVCTCAAKEDESSASGASPAPTLRASGRKASGLTTAGASTRSVGSESSVDVGDVMRLILSPLWTSPATRLGVLQGAAADPLAAVDLYDSSITEPMMVWNEPLRWVPPSPLLLRVGEGGGRGTHPACPLAIWGISKSRSSRVRGAPTLLPFLYLPATMRRADIRKFLDDEWRAIESWHLAHPTEPLK